MAKKILKAVIILLFIGGIGLTVFNVCHCNFGKQRFVNLSQDIELIQYYNGKFVVKNTKTGKITGRYDDVGIYMDKLLGQLIGITDLEMNCVADDVWLEHTLKERRAMFVKKDGKIGFLSPQTGREILEPQFEDVGKEDEQSGIIACMYPDGKVEFFNMKTGKKIISSDYFYYSPAWFDPEGDAEDDNGLRTIDSYEFQNGICKVFTPEGCGLIDTNGHFVLPAEYADIQDWNSPDFSNIILIKEKTENNNADKSECEYLYGLCNKAYKMIVPCEYDYLYRNINWDDVEVYIVTKDRKIGIIDNEGKVLAPIIYDELEEVEVEHAYLVKLNDKYGVIGKDYKMIIPVENDCLDVVYSSKNCEYTAYFIVGKGDIRKLYNEHGKMVSDFCIGEAATGLPALVSLPEPGTNLPSKYIKFCSNCQYGVTDIDGRIVIPADFDSINYIGNGNFICSLTDFDGLTILTSLMKDDNR